MRLGRYDWWAFVFCGLFSLFAGVAFGWFASMAAITFVSFFVSSFFAEYERFLDRRAAKSRPASPAEPTWMS